MKRSEKKKKRISRSIYIYILWNIILMLLLILFGWILIDQVCEGAIFKMILKETYAAHPEFTPEEIDDIVWYEKQGSVVEILISDESKAPDNVRKLCSDFITINNDIVEKYFPMLIVLFGIDLVFMVWLFVWKMKKRVVRELDSLDRAVNRLADISADGENDGAEILSGIKEFDRICENINRISASLTESEKEREKLEAARGKMLADISHDLKTPITVIQGYAKAINDGITDEATQRRYLDLIYKKSITVTELINTFHEYSKLDHPDFRAVRTQGDLCELFREYLAIKYEELDIAGYELETDIPDDPIMFSFDAGQLRRVFENLLSNCIKYNSSGTVLYASIKDNGSDIVIGIGDNGKGIPEAVRANIFEPFVVGSESRTDGKGSGLGLAICKRIVEAHGGKIALAESTEWSTLYEMTFYR